MIFFPNCKVNLGLHILNKRADGYHNLQTIFYPISIQDGLEIIQTDSSKEIDFTSSGFTIDGAANENICIKAYNLIKKDFPKLPAIKMHLHKAIPLGAGLGGGSADGAFTLLLLNKKFNLALSQKQLIDYALQLGSDCAFFIINQPCFATGRGENLIPVSLDLSNYKMIIVNPGIHINTAWAFSYLTPNDQRPSLIDVIKLPVTQWKNELTNDFEEPIFDRYTEIKNTKEQLYHEGAVFASMTGSGSSVYGIFEKEAQPKFTFPPHYFIKELVLLK